MYRTDTCTKGKLNEVLAQYPNPVATLEKVSDERERHVIVYRDRDTQRIIGVVEFNAYAEEVVECMVSEAFLTNPEL